MRPVAQIAQSVEQGIENPRVGGSIPSLGTTNTEQKASAMRWGFLLCGPPNTAQRAIFGSHPQPTHAPPPPYDLEGSAA